MRLPATILLLLCMACDPWRAVDPARVAGEPLQTELEHAEPIRFEAKGHQVTLTPRAAYDIRGVVVETSTQLLDRWDFVLPMDVSLAWGPAANPVILSQLSFHLSDRYLSYRWSHALEGIGEGQLQTHLSNNHLIPADDDVRRQLKRLRIGRTAHLVGKLVDLEIRGTSGAVERTSATSLVRSDVGSGACEQLWVESIEIE